MLTGARPGGSSLSGLFCGVAASVLFLYLFAFAFRKVPGFRWLFNRRPMAHYLARHIWLGIFTLPLVILHSGLLTRWGGPLTTVLTLVFLGVFTSGLWGIWLQQRLPRELLEHVPDETIRSQIPALAEQMREEAWLLVRASCGPPEWEDEPLTDDAAALAKAARRQRGAGVFRAMPAVQASPADAQSLWGYMCKEIDPYLHQGRRSRSRLRFKTPCNSDFEELRARLAAEMTPVVDALAMACERRRQYDEQADMHDRLHAWIGWHLSLSTALVVLVVCHAVTAVWHW